MERRLSGVTPEIGAKPLRLRYKIFNPYLLTSSHKLMESSMNNEHPLKNRWIKARTIQDYFDCSHGLVYKLMKQGSFPKPRKLSNGSVRWNGNDVIEWWESSDQETLK